MSIVRTLHSVVYRETPEKDVEMKMYLPEESASHGELSRPTFVLVHGGGWKEDRLGDFHHHLRGLATQGYVGVELSHRLSGEAIYPAPVEDVDYAIRWLKYRTDTYGVDPDRIVLGGHESGAHVAALVATASDDAGFVAEDAPDESSDVTAAVGIDGLYDLQKLAQMDASRLTIADVIYDLFGGEYSERPDAYAEASCVNHVDGNEPPFLLLTGVTDSTIPHYETIQLYDQLGEAGGDPKMFVGGGDNEFCFVKNPERTPTAMERLEQFLAEQLRADES